MNQLDAMTAFVRVAELGSFTQAAESLGLSKAHVTATVQRLEALVGTRLLHRTTRRVQLTQDGQDFHERCRDLLADMEELRTLFQRGEGGTLRGRLRVDMPIGTARNLVVPRLPEFMQAHPGIEIELSSTDRRVDLVREGFDCVLRVGSLGDSSLVARPLGHYRMANCASPSYVARFGLPRSPDELSAHRLVHYAPSLGGKPIGFEVDDGEGGVRALPMAGALTVNNSEAYLGACLAGIGIVQVPRAGVAGLLASRELVELLPQHLPPAMPVNLLYAHRRHLPKRVQAFMAWVAEVMRPHL